MSSAVAKPWTEVEFFAWHERQERRHELLDGAPRLMTGANNRHNRVAMGIYGALRSRLRGGRCSPSAPFATAVRIPGGNIRYPDVLVDCGPYRPDDHAAAEPVLVVEIPSSSTGAFDHLRKLEEYRSVPEVRHVLLLDAEAPRAQLFSRDEAGGWSAALIEGADAEIPLAALGITLPLDECYGDALG